MRQFTSSIARRAFGLILPALVLAMVTTPANSQGERPDMGRCQSVLQELVPQLRLARPRLEQAQEQLDPQRLQSEILAGALAAPGAASELKQLLACLASNNRR